MTLDRMKPDRTTSSFWQPDQGTAYAIMVWVLNILWKHQLYLKAEKCTFGQPMVEYLSLILSEGHVEMDLIKVTSVHDWLTLKSVSV